MNSRDWYNEIGPKIGEPARLQSLANAYDALTRQRIARVAPALAGQACLEIGPGRGTVAEYLLSRTGEAGSVTLVDLSFEHLRRTAAAGSILCQSDVRSYRFPPNHFAFIVSRSVLHLFRQRRLLLRRCVESLQRGGVLVIETFDFGPAASAAPEPLASTWWALKRAASSVGIEANWSSRLAQHLEHAGARVIETDSVALIGRGGTPANEYWLRTLVDLQQLLRGAGLQHSDWLEACEALADSNRWSLLPSSTFAAGRRDE